MSKKTPDHVHKMTLHNQDLVITWHWENEHVKITDINILHSEFINMLQFMSGKNLKLIVDNIEKYES
jgi:hypothetical protein